MNPSPDSKEPAATKEAFCPAPVVSRFLPGVAVTLTDAEGLVATYVYAQDPVIRADTQAAQNILALANPRARSRTVRLLSSDSEIYVGTDAAMTEAQNTARCHVMSNKPGTRYPSKLTLEGGLPIYAKTGSREVHVSVEEISVHDAAVVPPEFADYGMNGDLIPRDWNHLSL